jgi:lytic murein transglycosylase
MAVFARVRIVAVACAMLGMTAGRVHAAACGKDGSGFAAWLEDYRASMEARGVDTSPLDNVKYDTAIIRLDRNQKGAFKGTVEQFLARRAPASYVSKAKGYMKSQAGLLKKIQKQYGVQPEVILAIWGMETGFGANSGNKSVFQPLATLAYDCRRSAYFTNHLYAALQLVQRGTLSPSATGAAHGEIGQTQFLPASVLRYGVDGDGNGRMDLARSKADALASTANCLRGHGWRAGGGYQPGQANYGALQGWNAASVYQQAIAIIGAEIDGQ